MLCSKKSCLGMMITNMYKQNMSRARMLMSTIGYHDRGGHQFGRDFLFAFGPPSWRMSVSLRSEELHIRRNLYSRCCLLGIARRIPLPPLSWWRWPYRCIWRWRLSRFDRLHRICRLVFVFAIQRFELCALRLSSLALLPDLGLPSCMSNYKA